MLVDNEENESAQGEIGAKSHEETDWRKKEGDNKHYDAYAADDEQSDNNKKQKSEYQKLLERYTLQEIALLRALQHEKAYRKNLKQNNGKRKSL